MILLDNIFTLKLINAFVEVKALKLCKRLSSVCLVKSYDIFIVFIFVYKF